MESYIKIFYDSTIFFNTPTFGIIQFNPFNLTIISKIQPKKIVICYFNIIGWKRNFDCLEITYFNNIDNKIETIKILHPFIHKIITKMIDKINIIQKNV